MLARTDGAAIFALLRNSTLRRRLARALEGESGLNDPVAVLLVLALIEFIKTPGYDFADATLLLVRQLGIGLAVGVAVGWLGVQAFRRAQLATAGLYPVASLAIAALAFGGADTLHGSGFLAVYLAGLALGSARDPRPADDHRVPPGARVGRPARRCSSRSACSCSRASSATSRSRAPCSRWSLVFVARPLAVFLATAFAKFGKRERIVLGWAGLRGAVPVVLATFPVIDRGAGQPRVLQHRLLRRRCCRRSLQGSTFEPLAARLGVTTSEPALPRPLAEGGTIRRLGAEILEYPIAADDAIVGRARARPRPAARRGRQRDRARRARRSRRAGRRACAPGDRLHVLVRQEVARELHELQRPLARRPDRPAAAAAPRRCTAARPMFSAWRVDASATATRRAPTRSAAAR